ncbi:MAG: hypothetical protein QOH79_3647 [Acidimicrobiaceae bacterium]
MTRRLLTSVALVAISAFSACSDSKPPPGSSASAFDPFATELSSVPPEPGSSPTALAVGDCFNSDQFAPGLSIDRRGVHVIACTDPHQHEVYAVERDPDPAGAPFPGDASMRAFADDVCLAAFEPAIGAGYVQSALDYATITPDATSWKDGDRSVICAVHDVDFAELLGSRLAAASASLASEGR